MTLRARLDALLAAGDPPAFTVGQQINVTYNDGHVYKAFVQRVKGSTVLVSWAGKYFDHEPEWMPVAKCKPIGAKKASPARPVAQPSVTAQPRPADPARVRSEIERVYLKVTGGKFAVPVTLDKLRRGVSASRSEFDAALAQILRGDAGQAHPAILSQYSDPKTLTPEVKAATYAPAGEPFHLLWIQGSRR